MRAWCKWNRIAEQASTLYSAVMRAFDHVERLDGGSRPGDQSTDCYRAAVVKLETTRYAYAQCLSKEVELEQVLDQEGWPHGRMVRCTKLTSQGFAACRNCHHLDVCNKERKTSRSCNNGIGPTEVARSSEIVDLILLDDPTPRVVLEQKFAE